MKTSIITASTVTVMALGMLTGCAQQNATGSVTIGECGTTSTVSAESARQAAQKIAKIDGCTITTPGAAPLYNSVNTTPLRGYDIDYSEYGSCGGELHHSGRHDNGNTDVKLQYTNYCTNTWNREFILSGRVDRSLYGTPSDTGPVFRENHLNISTKMEAEIKENTGDIAYYDLYMYEYVQYYSGDDLSTPPTQTSPDRIRVTSATIEKDKEYVADSVSAQFYFLRSSVKVTQGDGCYTDPDLGAYKMSTTDVTIPYNARKFPVGAYGELDFSASDGTTGVLRATQQGIITIIVDGNSSATQQIDCSQFLADIQ